MEKFKIQKYAPYIMATLMVGNVVMDIYKHDSKLPQDFSQNNPTILYSTSASVSGSVLGSTFTVTALWPLTELQSTSRLNGDGNGYYEVKF